MERLDSVSLIVLHLSTFRFNFHSMHHLFKVFKSCWSWSSPYRVDHIEFSEEDVHQGLIKLDPTKAKGCDQLHPMILRLCTDSLTHPLHKLFTASLNSGIIPSEWKIHKICPIPKSGNPLHVENYRPISLLCNTGKVLERLVYDKIIHPSLLSNNTDFSRTDPVSPNFSYPSTSSMII